MKYETAPGVIAPAQVVGEPPTVSHWFSLARSPPLGTARSGFWLGKPPASGAVSLSGGYAPGVPGSANRLGSGRLGRMNAGTDSVSPPSVQSLPFGFPLPPPVPNGQRLVSVFWTAPLTGMLPTRPKGVEQPLLDR